MKLEFGFGTGVQTVEVPDRNLRGVLRANEAPAIPSEEEEIRRYIATGEPMDKAGAYGAQGRGALFVEHIEGDFFNVMGLPLCRLGKMLKEQGVNIL
jgi:septum formation protein